MNLLSKAVQTYHFIKLSLKTHQNTTIEQRAENPKKRLSYELQRQRSFYGLNGQDDLRLAIEMAEDPCNPRREMLLYIYKEALRDFHLLSQIRTANYKVISEPWAIVDKKTKEVKKELTELLQKKWFEDLNKHILDSEYWGHSLIEFGVMEETEPENKAFAPFEFKDVKLIPREHVRPETGELLIMPGEASGLKYREEPYNTWLLEAGDPYDLGLLMIAAKYCIYKKFSLSDWSRSSEKWGDPLLVIGSSSDNDEENSKKEQFAANFGNNGYVITDDDDKIQLLERSNGNGYLIFKDFIDTLNSENSKGINGQTGTSDQKSFVGSAEVHERILDDYTESRLRSIAYYHNDQTIPFLIKHGYKLEGCAFMPLKYLSEMKTSKPQDANGGADEKKHLSLSLSEQINRLYFENTCDHNECTIELSYNNPTNIDSIIERAIERMYKRKGKQGIDRKLTEANANKLWQAVQKGYEEDRGGRLKYGSPEQRLLIQMRYNTAVTAVFKNHQNAQEMTRALFDENGKIKPFSQFKKEAMAINDKYNKTWLQAEYETAVSSARGASKWAEFKRKGGMLTFMTQGDGKVSDEHKMLHGATYAVEHSFWKTNYPPLRYKCRCFVRWAGYNAPEVAPQGLPEIPEAFRNNAGETGKVFSDSHPYFNVDGSFKKDADKLFGYKPAVTLDKFDQNIKQYEALSQDKNYKLEAVDNLTGGHVFRHIKADKTELPQLMPAARIMASNGEGVVIKEISTIKGAKNPDMMIGGIDTELKTNKIGSINSIDHALRRANKQADHVILDIKGDINTVDLDNAIYNRVKRTSIKKVSVIYKDTLYDLSYEEIIAKTFFGKIK